MGGEQVRGVRLSVLRNALGDSTNGGITATATFVVLVDDRLTAREANDNVNDRTPGVRLIETAPGYQVLVPIESQVPGSARSIGPMAGGSYAVGNYGGRDAWKRLTGSYGALPVHDRFETQAQYDALSI